MEELIGRILDGAVRVCRSVDIVNIDGGREQRECEVMSLSKVFVHDNTFCATVEEGAGTDFLRREFSDEFGVEGDRGVTGVPSVSNG